MRRSGCRRGRVIEPERLNRWRKLRTENAGHERAETKRVGGSAGVATRGADTTGDRPGLRQQLRDGFESFRRESPVMRTGLLGIDWVAFEPPQPRPVVF